MTARRVARRIRGRAVRCRGEQGTSLLIAMAFLGLLSVAVVSLLVLTMANAKTTTAVRTASGETFGADGGVDIGIQLLRSTSSYCNDAASGTQVLPTQTIDGRTVTLTCQTLSGSAGGGTPSVSSYAMVATGYTDANGKAADLDNAIKMHGSSTVNGDTMTINGNVFDAGNLTLDNAPPTLTINGDLRQYNDPPKSYCTGDKADAANKRPIVTGTWYCDLASGLPVPDPAPTLKVPSSAAPAATVAGACTTYYPGRYTSKPTFDKDKKFYFASGVYYFDDVGEIALEGQIFGGAPGPADTQQITNVSPCSNDAAANATRPGSATGSGVQFILGKGSKIKIKDDQKQKIELFQRVPANAALEGTPGVTVYAPRTNGSNWLSNTADKVLDMDGAKVTVVIHGLWYSPGSDIKDAYALDNGGAGGAPLFGDGVIAATIEVDFKSTSIGAKIANLPAFTPATTRTTVVTATATDPSGGAPVTEQAVVQLGTSAGTPATILSWRKT